MKNRSKVIIEAIRSGKNQDALKYLYKDPLNKIRKYILTNSGSIDDANDVFQDAVITLFHYVQKGKYKDEYDLEGFLFRVAKNSWIDLARKKKKIIKEDLKGYDTADDTNQLQDMIKQERSTTFYALFNKLEENCRKILSYVIFEKKSMKEISILMDLKDERVAKNQHYRCKKYFSKILFENKEALNILKN